MTGSKGYSVYLYNFGYVLPETRASVEEALSYGKSKGFSFIVHSPYGTPCVSWDPIRGEFDRRKTVDAVA